MKNVLVISYYWPPAGGPGSLRVLKFAKYLPQFGWKPVILSVKNGEFPYTDNSLEADIKDDCPVFYSSTIEPFTLYKKLTGKDSTSTLPVGQLTQKPDKIQHKLFNWLRTNIFIPDARMGWILPGYLRAKKIIRQQKIQAMISSSPPHSLQLMAYLINKKFNLPWIADFRDPWTEIQYYQISKRNKLSQSFDLCLEKKILRNANHITTVSSSIGQTFSQKLNLSCPESKISIIPNGWDPDEFKHDSKPDSSKFIILHTGNLNATQNPTVLWKSLQHLLEFHPTFKKDLILKFVGRVHENIRKTITHSNLDAYTEYPNFIPHKQVIVEIQKAAILLSVVPDVPDNKGIVTSKNFEYIGSGLPILVVGPTDSDIAHTISEFRHSQMINYNNIKTCETFITERYQAWKNRENPQSSRELRHKYSRVSLTGKLAEILDKITPT